MSLSLLIGPILHVIFAFDQMTILKICFCFWSMGLSKKFDKSCSDRILWTAIFVEFSFIVLRRNRVMLSHNLFSHTIDDFSEVSDLPKSLVFQMAVDRWVSLFLIVTDALTLRTVMTAILNQLKVLLVFANDNSCITSRGRGDGWQREFLTAH